MAEATVQILAVDPKTVNTKYGAKTLYKISASDGRSYDAWKAELGTQATALLNQQATLTFTEKPNGEYTNYDVTAIKTANGAAPTPVAAQPIAAPPGPTEKDKSIWRQSSHKIAYGFYSSLLAAGVDPTEVLAQADELAITLYKRFAGQSTAPAPTPQPEPAPVLAAAPEVVAAPTQPAAEAQDDLPWDAA